MNNQERKNLEILKTEEKDAMFMLTKYSSSPYTPENKILADNFSKKASALRWAIKCLEKYLSEKTSKKEKL